MLFHSPPGVLFTFPSQYCALSVTESYLALGGGPPVFPQGSTCLAVLWILLASVGFHVRGFHPLWQAFPKPFCYPSSCFLQSEPHGQVHGLGSSGFARRYFRNRCFFLFLALLRCFSSGGSLCMTMDSSCSDGGSLRRVAPFRDPRINRYLLLPVAFRSLSRLSSALSAKSFTLCPLSLDLFRCAGSRIFLPSLLRRDSSRFQCSVTYSRVHFFALSLVKESLDEIDFSLLFF